MRPYSPRLATISYGDYPDILWHRLAGESVDLGHRDPPFHSAPNCNAFVVLSKLRSRGREPAPFFGMCAD